MVLEVTPMFHPHAIYQIEPSLLLKVVAPIWYQEHTSLAVNRVHLGPSLELLHVHILL